MKILLFDLWSGGHNPLYFQRFAEALAGHDVYVAAPEPVLARLGDIAVNCVSIGRQARQAPIFGRPEEAWDASISDELRLIRDICADLQPERFIHLFADHLVSHWLADLTRCSTSLLVFYPSSHYPQCFGSVLSEMELQKGLRFDQAVARCRSLASVRSIMVLDPYAADIWGQSAGVPVYWLPEPPIVDPDKFIVSGSPQADLVFFGALAHRKGLSRLTSAVKTASLKINIVIAGWVEQAGYEREINREVEEMRQAGAQVELALHHHTEEEILDILMNAKCTVLPYWRHFGMSRVLLESCLVGTPVLVHDFGMLAHLVRKHQLGTVVDCDDPAVFAAAILDATKLGWRSAILDRCKAFAAGFSRSNFQAIVQEAVL